MSEQVRIVNDTDRDGAKEPTPPVADAEPLSVPLLPATPPITRQTFANKDGVEGCRDDLGHDHHTPGEHVPTGRFFAGGHVEDVPPEYTGRLWGLDKGIDWGQYNGGTYLIGALGYSVGSHCDWYGLDFEANIANGVGAVFFMINCAIATLEWLQERAALSGQTWPGAKYELWGHALFFLASFLYSVNSVTFFYQSLDPISIGLDLAASWVFMPCVTVYIIGAGRNDPPYRLKVTGSTGILAYHWGYVELVLFFIACICYGASSALLFYVEITIGVSEISRREGTTLEYIGGVIDSIGADAFVAGAISIIIEQWACQRRLELGGPRVRETLISVCSGEDRMSFCETSRASLITTPQPESRKLVNSEV